MILHEQALGTGLAPCQPPPPDSRPRLAGPPGGFSDAPGAPRPLALALALLSITDARMLVFHWARALALVNYSLSAAPSETPAISKIEFLGCSSCP